MDNKRSNSHFGLVIAIVSLTLAIVQIIRTVSNTDLLQALAVGQLLTLLALIFFYLAVRENSKRRK